ncbi:hypothetical protein [Marinobacter sp. P4B1]|uniref:hypothetical protein n=1 Tax=Marinobacter sp. P4B1 TaxID=1119533 RepID=UPI00071C7540|nr:hypothetical protein [Marinobacter sp. P4B1]KRW83777.1 hypothetical protein AQ621_17150 [Marinobacter sp. P4B1]
MATLNTKALDDNGESVEFLRGILFALSRLDYRSTEYEDIVNQAGGFDLLLSVAEDCDKEHVEAAMKALREDDF